VTGLQKAEPVSLTSSSVPLMKRAKLHKVVVEVVFEDGTCNDFEFVVRA
jgi:hypothetical protein